MCVRVPQIVMETLALGTSRSVQGTATAIGATQTRNLCVLRRKLVIVGDLFIDADWLPGVYHYLLLRLHSDDLCIAVRLPRKHMCTCKR